MVMDEKWPNAILVGNKGNKGKIADRCHYDTHMNRIVELMTLTVTHTLFLETLSHLKIYGSFECHVFARY